jgi:hypothetical protein
MKRATLILAVVAVLLTLANPASADFIYDASGTFNDALTPGVTYTLSGKVTFDPMGGLVSDALLVKSSDGTTTYIDTKAGNPSVSLQSFSDMHGTAYDRIIGTTDINPTVVAILELPFLQSDIGKNSIDLLPSVDLGNGSSFSGVFKFVNPSTSVDITGDLASGELTLESTSSVPEPSTLTLLGIGSLSLLGYGWRRRNRAAA